MLLVEERFIENIKTILKEGSLDRDVRPSYKDGTKAYTKFITQVCEKYDIGKKQFPITGLRPIAWKSGLKEVLWIYRDKSNNLDLLKDKYGVTWWDSWDIGDRSIGSCYGAVVKKYDLVNKLLKGLKENPFGRRHIIDLWQYEELDKVHGLDPCAFETIWSVRQVENELFLDMTLIQRSSDYLVAGHINKMQYVCLMMMFAKHLGYKLGCFTHFVQNLHIYDRSFEQANELIRRFEEYKNKDYTKDEFSLHQQTELILDTDKTNFYDFEVSDFKIVEYNTLGQLKFDLAI